MEISEQRNNERDEAFESPHQSEKDSKTLELLPKDMLCAIFSFLSLEHLHSLRLVNRRLRALVEEFRISHFIQWNWEQHEGSHRSEDLIVEDEKVSLKIKSVKVKKNFAIFASQALTKNNCHFRVQVVNPVKFAVGVAMRDNFSISGRVLGTQSGFFNASYYFWNDSSPEGRKGISRLQTHGEEVIDAMLIQSGAIIDVKVDFNDQIVYFWLNNALQGALKSRKYKFEEGKLYPCVNLSTTTEIVWRNRDVPPLNLSMTPEEESDGDEEVEYPEAPFPTQWKWDIDPKKKADVIDIDETGLFASRKTGGHNPAVMTTKPFTRKSWYFQVVVVQRSRWVGIGLADKKLRLNGSRTLGNQRRGVNSAYFWQVTEHINTHKLQMSGESTINLSNTLVDNDVIGISVDFDAQTISYYRNNACKGVIKCKNRKLKEGKLYPTVDLSAGSIVKIQNVGSDPTLKSNNAL